ncbi:12534_t:CDS:1 [Ambispora leptoticha]|uniref:12534_t:CDS:1 n=1 Tax=Ambispora leptoticha TaxID=144679 RepID=A0A9N9FCK1_9GLOM|nr:12534_t:CDS:1 [Ambispora leptoticha]
MPGKIINPQSVSYNSFADFKSTNKGTLNELAINFLKQINKGTQYAEIIDDIKNYLEQQNLQLSELLEQLQKGKRQYKCLLGFCYERIPECQDPAKAFTAYNDASQSNFPFGYLFLAACYENGIGVRRSFAKAFKNYKKAEEYNNLQCTCIQYRLGRCYERGIGTSVNMDTAFDWYMKAATSGNTGAQNKLGYWYEEGIHVKKDPKKAFTYYYEAAKGGFVCAQYNTAECLRLGIGTTKGALRAFYWYQRAAENGDPNSQYWLAYHYHYGIATAENNELALKWYLKAAEAATVTIEVARVYYSLGCIYDYRQLGVKRDDKKAFGWYKKASNAGVIEATKRLAKFYQNGFGTDVDIDKAYAMTLIAKEHYKEDSQNEYRYE